MQHTYKVIHDQVVKLLWEVLANFINASISAQTKEHNKST